MLALLASVNRLDFRSRLFDRDAGLQLTHRLIHLNLRGRRNLARRRLQRHHPIRRGIDPLHRGAKHVRRQLRREVRRQDGADRHLAAIDGQRPADHAGIAVKLLAEGPVSQDEDLRVLQPRQRPKREPRSGQFKEPI